LKIEFLKLLTATNVGIETQSKIELLKIQTKFPVEQDLQGAAVALTRLQEVYKLETVDVSGGILNGVKYRYVKIFKIYKINRVGFIFQR
jgi:hypothetical protein